VNKLAELFRKNEDSMFELAGKINEDSKVRSTPVTVFHAGSTTH